MHPAPPDTPRPTRYPVWLGLASFVWAPTAWALAALAPQLAFVPLVEFLHTTLPAITGTLILANLAFSLWALRRRVPVDRLLLVTALQLGLFTALFYQVSAHFGAEHYELDRPAKSWDWVQFSLAHALKATDVLDTIEAYGLDVQNVTHRGPYLATLLVIYHAVIELFMLGMLWAIVGVWKRHVMSDPVRAKWIQRTLWLLFGVWLIAWLVSALWLRPWRLIDIPLWLAENVVRVLDFADAMDSYDIHWHQVPRGPWESTLTFICRVWVALGIGLFLNWRTGPTKARPGVGHHKVPPFSRVARLGVAVVILGLFVGVSHIVLANDDDPVPALVTAASETDDARATAALNALRRLGPNAAGTVVPLAEARGRVGPDRRRKITETLSYLGPTAVGAMADIAASGDAAEAMLATEGLERVGPSAAPTLVLVGKGSPHEKVRSRAGEALRGFGPKAMPALVAGVTPENSADFYPWFVELDRNWTLRNSPNPTFRAIVSYQQGKLLADLMDKDHHVRKAAVQTLALIGPGTTETVPALIYEFPLNEHWHQWETAKAQGKIGPVAVLALIDALADKDRLVREAAAETLGKIGPGAKGAIPALINALADKGVFVRQAAAEALGKIDPGAKDTGPALITALADKDILVRQAAAEALAQFGSGTKDAVPALIKALADNDVRDAAAEALGKMGTKDAVNALSNALADKEWLVQWAAAEALEKMGPGGKDAVPALIKALADKDCIVRSRAARTLGKIGPGAKDADSALIKALADNDWLVREAAAEALGKIGPGANGTVAALITALADKDWRVGQSAAEALGKLGPAAKDALNKLREAQAKDTDERVRAEATRAIRLIEANPTKP